MWDGQEQGTGDCELGLTDQISLQQSIDLKPRVASSCSISGFVANGRGLQLTGMSSAKPIPVRVQHSSTPRQPAPAVHSALGAMHRGHHMCMQTASSENGRDAVSISPREFQRSIEARYVLCSVSFHEIKANVLSTSVIRLETHLPLTAELLNA